MKISIGVLESSQRLLEVVRRNVTVGKAVKDELPKILVMQTEPLLDLAVRCAWLSSDGHGGLQLSPRGHEIAELGASPLALREQVADILSTTRPVWLGQVPKGRNEALAIIASDARYVLREAGLLETPPDRDVVAWWDKVAADARAERSSIQLDTGRTGERLSIAFELARTGSSPSWVGVESNLAGYDLLSRESDTSATPLPIEVKASNSLLSSAHFYVSENEWKVAMSGRPYVFHLWVLKDQPRLAVVTPKAIADHVSKNNGAGRWESVRIPMAEFANLFDLEASAA